MDAPMDEAGVFHSASFMVSDAVAGMIQAVVVTLALVGSYRFVRRVAITTSQAVHRLTMLAMFACSSFAWLTFGYLFFRHNLETCIVRVWPARGRIGSARAPADTLLCSACAAAVLGLLDLRGLLRGVQG
jgi:hypothetical protein